MAIWERLNHLLRSEKNYFLDNMEESIEESLTTLGQGFTHFRQKLRQYGEEMADWDLHDWNEALEDYLNKIKRLWQESFGQWHEPGSDSNRQKWGKDKQNEDSYYQKAWQDFQQKTTAQEFPEVILRHFAALEISPTRDTEAIKSAWKKMMRRYHPDLFHGDDKKREVAVELSARITQAYQELINFLDPKG